MSKHTGITLGVDVGGTHFSAALAEDGRLLADTYRRLPVDAAAGAAHLLDTLAGLMNAVMGLVEVPVSGIGIAIPGPFDYDGGVSMIQGLNKYENLYGLNIREALRDRLKTLAVPIRFENDAACFGLGAARSAAGKKYNKLIVVTLGTGLGACFIDHGLLLKSGPGVPTSGYLYNIPFKGGIAEDYLSARWLLGMYPATTVREMAERAGRDAVAAAAFRELGVNLGLLLTPWIRRFEADAIVIGGGIASAYALFGPSMGLEVPVIVPEDAERVGLAGAAGLAGAVGLQGSAGLPGAVVGGMIPARKTTQALLPQRMGSRGAAYELYPSEPLGSGKIFSGYAALARWIAGQKGVRLDGYAGVDWDLVRSRLCSELRALGLAVNWYETKAFLQPAERIESMVKPFLGEEGSVWGTKTELSLGDWYSSRLYDWRPEEGAGINILAGVGAGLSGWEGKVVYFDLPKNELQYRMRAGSATNLGTVGTGPFTEMYKRCYFVDWVVLNRHRRTIGDEIVVVVDGQHEEEPNWALLDSVVRGMRSMTRNLIRARPWFEPGVWGGQWLKQHIPGLSRKEVNYAWSFELIAPENGIVLESDGLLLEVAFDWLMQLESNAVLGVDAATFGEEFPIRFDFLDTFGGGNLSIQCHPSLPYIREHFGERITQDETYYILDCKPGAGVYLGFTDDIEPEVFRQALEKSQESNQGIDIEEYVQLLPAKKHDLFLIPNKTIHGAGVNNLVLEISATPYIFTFKMYDWMRLDLEGMPRPINIGHAFHNLDFTRKGPVVTAELVSRPRLLRSEVDMKLELLPTHPEHFYAIHRITLSGRTRIGTEGRCHLLMLVEGRRVIVVTGQGRRYVLYYAETFVLPAAAGEYELINEGESPIVLIKAFVK
jgi:predicted NBD/HSP70 family sugar kinase/mannose-6-phosphate isomerase class I